MKEQKREAVGDSVPNVKIAPDAKADYGENTSARGIAGTGVYLLRKLTQPAVRSGLRRARLRRNISLLM